MMICDPNPRGDSMRPRVLYTERTEDGEQRNVGSE